MTDIGERRSAHEFGNCDLSFPMEGQDVVCVRSLIPAVPPSQVSRDHPPELPFTTPELK